ncbi:MAG: hypothetical protein AB7O59_09640 [Pirellulales bacterium]
MAKPKKIGEDFAREAVVKGWFELGDAFSFQGSNITQPHWYGLYGRSGGELTDQGHLIDRDFDEQPGRSELGDEHDLEQDRDEPEMDMDEMER